MDGPGFETPASYSMGSSPGRNWTGCEVDHLLLTMAESKNEWSYMSAPPIRFDGGNRDTLLF